MQDMKRIATYVLAAVAATALLAGCKQSLTPEQELAVSLISQKNGEVSKIDFSQFELIDSTTLGQEMQRRISLFETKVRIEGENVAKYESRNMPVNAKRHRDSMLRSQAILDSINHLADSLSSCRDRILYRTYQFACTGTFTDKTKFSCEKMYLNVTPDGINTCLKDTDNYHKGMGITIPGYLDVMYDNRTEDNE